MKRNEEIAQLPGLLIRETADDGGCGRLFMKTDHLNKAATVVWSWGGGWDHVSVSFRNRCPTWDEMCIVKDLFFYPDECCIEYHPAAADYVNNMPYCLHIWRPQNQELPRPPKNFV